MSEPAQLATSLSSEERRLFEETIARFEQTWHQNGPCHLDDFLPAGGPLRAALLEELVAIDIEFRQRRGEHIDKEEYLRRFPELKVKLPKSAEQSTVSLAQQTVAQQTVDTVKVEPTELPAVFGRYRIVKSLGQGAMGAVYLAHDQQLHRQVALKIPKFAEADSQELLARFYREARLAAALHHPNICPVFDVGEIDGRHYITMAFIEGRSLNEFIASKRMQPQRQAAIVIRKLAVALEEAHTRGVIHRDLKPANIMIDAKGEPIVMDFGLARRASNEEAQVTHSGMILGTPAYMSPEQVDGDQTQIGPAADVYSLGVILYELLTRQRPFQGSVMSVLQQIGAGNPQPPSHLRSDIDPVLEGICLKMMSRQQADRYPSMAAVAQALTEYLKAAPSQGSRTTSPSAGVTVTTTEPSQDEASAATFLLPSPTDAVTVLAATKVLERSQRATVVATKPADRRRSRNWSLVGIGLAGIVLLLGATFFFRVGNVDVKVVIDDPRLAVKFDKETVTFEGSGSPIRLKPGEHKFIVERDGLEVETDHFVVKKNGQHVLEVTVVDGKVVVRKDDQKPIASGLASKSDSSSPPKAGWHGWPANAPAPAIAPFDSEQAKAHQEAWAKHLGVPVEFTNSIGMKFRLIPPGEFTMGSTPEEIETALKHVAQSDPDSKKLVEDLIKSEGPQHKVILTQPYYLGVHEVRQQDYESVTGVNPSIFSRNGPQPAYRPNFDTSQMPVESVSWIDAAAFCSKLSTKEKLKPRYLQSGNNVTPLEGNGYRLPSEAEWEHACRAGTTTRAFFAKDEDASQFAWLANPAGGRPYPVGQLKPNPFGLFDIYGNNMEWVQDGWTPTAYEQAAGQPAVDPATSFLEASRRIVRGPVWPFSAVGCRSSFRHAEPAASGRHYTGVRVALSVEAVKFTLANPVKAEAVPEQDQNAASTWKGWPTLQPTASLVSASVWP